ncbi:hypothetical protein [Pseudohaliea rubra]|uniref:Transcriptional regulator SutA RNAP-binding domain-containing protein n=1 Tax=Pseudohaliea rubra DSM 19751 TaxID=1265313 RepID=A0A095VS99_9GAMM|nr:hypothetical protein [Pseudohaliea rubra]KGE04240.1 hypothetical protein HRUBRA_01104 [Pseudohaliea rubra DSM 19751]
MQHSNANVNPVEKQRLRETINEEVSHFLAAGGAITVLDAPVPGGRDYCATAWQDGDGVDELLD